MTWTDFVEWLRQWGPTIWVCTVGAAATVFSVVFGFERIGYKVKARFITSIGILTADSISSITLINCKNKPVVIFDIEAVVDNTYVVRVYKPDVPIVLKPLEAQAIEVPPVSAYFVGDDRYRDGFGPLVTFYLATAGKIIECESADVPDTWFDPMFKTYRRLRPYTNRFNGHVINERASYAVLYGDGEDTKTAIVRRDGFIGGQWGFKPNMLRPEHMTSREAVKKALDASGIEALIGPFTVTKLDTPPGLMS